MTEFNSIFPSKDDDEPERDPTADELFDTSELIEELEIEEMTDGIETELRDVSAKLVFEFVIMLINPPPDERKKIVDGLVKMAAGRVENDINAQVSTQELEPAETKELNDRVNTAFTEAQKKFREDYENCFFDDAFLERCRKAVRKNLSR